MQKIALNNQYAIAGKEAFFLPTSTKRGNGFRFLLKHNNLIIKEIKIHS